jgi:geranylgeranyl pyrophosphate synthase
MIHFLRTAPTEHRALLRSLLSSGDADKAERIRNLLLPTQSIQYAHDRARQLVDKALGAIADLPESEAKSVLQTMGRFVIARPM